MGENKQTNKENEQEDIDIRRLRVMINIYIYKIIHQVLYISLFYMLMCNKYRIWFSILYYLYGYLDSTRFIRCPSS